MRYYDLKITANKAPQATKKVETTSQGKASAYQQPTTVVEEQSILHLCSYVQRDPNGPGFLPGLPIDQFDPGALDIQFDISLTNLTAYDEGNSDAAITIRGVDIYTINQASNLVGRTVSLQAGMGKGFPLSNPNQAGEILRGTVQSAIGNWESTDLSLTLFVSKYVIPPSPQNNQSGQDTRKTDQKNDAQKKQPKSRYQITCTRGNDLLTAIKSALQRANPTYDVIISIDGPIPCSEDAKGTYRSLKELCVAIHDIWKQQAQNQKDIFITMRGHEFHVINLDPTPPITFTPIEFHELIGQPSWNGETEISFTCPMRGNIHVGDIISLPLNHQHPTQKVGSTQTPVNPSQNAYGLISKTQGTAALTPKDRCLFSGYFRVTSIKHTGKFRDTDGRNWASTFSCTPYMTAATEPLTKKSGT